MGAKQEKRDFLVSKMRKKTILITGHLGHLGRYLCQSLEEEGRYLLLGIDHDQQFSSPKQKGNLLHKSIEEMFLSNSIDSVIHLDLIHDPKEDWTKRNIYNLAGTNHLLHLCSKYKIKKFIFLSTANVYGPSPKNPQLISEIEPLLATAYSSGPDDLVKSDLLVSSFFWKSPQLEIVILRPCHIIGPLENGIVHYLSMKRPITILGFDPMIQLIHIDDLIQVFKYCLNKKIKGIFNIRGPGEISLHRFLQQLGKTPFPLPTMVAKTLMTTLWNLQLSDFPPYELPYLQYPCMVDDSLFRSKTPYTPQKGFSEIISCLDDHPLNQLKS